MVEESFPRGRGGSSQQNQVPTQAPLLKDKKRDREGVKETNTNKNDGAADTPRLVDATQKDFLFGNANPQASEKPLKKRKKVPSSNITPSTSLNPLGGGGVIPADRKKGRLPLIESAGFSKLQKGTKVLGIVREVSEDYAIVSLPNMLTGYVSRGEVCVIIDKAESAVSCRLLVFHTSASSLTYLCCHYVLLLLRMTHHSQKYSTRIK
jgi:hypothetical protein